MQACLYSGNADLSAFRNLFPGMGPGELPLAGKSICRHMVDLCGRLKVSDVLLADRELNPELAGELGDGSYWSLRLTFLNCEYCASLNSLLELRKRCLGGDDDVLIIWGMVLPDIREEEELFRDLRETDPDRDAEPGVYLFREGRCWRCSCPLFRCSDLKSYFEINFRLLQQTGVYSLPGYSSQRGFGIGRSVSILPKCDIREPVLILDDAFIARGAVMNNGAVVGRNSVIDENTEISHSIVFDNTYVGRSMVIRDKIVCGRRVLDPRSNSYVDLDDSFLADEFPSKLSGFLFMPAEHLFALFLAVAELPVYLAVLAGWKFFRGMPFPRLLRRIYPKFWRAAFGHVQLVRFGSKQEYIFRYADLWWPAEKSEYEKNMADVYYYHHRTFRRVVAVALVSQLKRLPAWREPESGAEKREPES